MHDEPAKSIAVVSFHTCPWETPGTGDAGGLNVYAREIADGFARLGWQVDVFTRAHATMQGSGQHHHGPQENSGIRLIHIPAGPENSGKDDLHHCLDEFTANVSAWIMERAGSYRAVLSHYWLSGLVAIDLARVTKAPHLASFHTLSRVKQHYFPEEKTVPVRLEGEIRVIAEADMLVANSCHEKQALQEFYGVNTRRIVVASPAVNADQFRPGNRSEARQRLKLPLDAKIIVCAGRNSPIKGFGVLAKALDRISWPITAILIGEHNRSGSDASSLQLAGAVEHDRMRDYFLAADVCVVPSQYESFGMVTQEALACGCPVVASRVGGLTAQINDGVDGLLVPPGDSGALARALEQVLSCPNRFTMNAEKRPSWDDTTAQFLAALRDLA